MNVDISKKIRNHEYAPGLTTYGIDGKNGEAGENGNTIFVSKFQIPNQIEELGLYVIENRCVNLSNNNILTRSYITDDMFLCPNGSIYQIKDIVLLKQAAAERQLTQNTYLDYFTLVGSINLNNNTLSEGFIKNPDTNRFVLDTGDGYNQFLINLTNNDNISLSDAPFAIVTSAVDNNGSENANLINMKCITSGSDDTNFNIYYNSQTKAFHMQSDTPIVIEADLKVINDKTSEYDEYSKVATSDNSITSFANICKNIVFKKTKNGFKLINNNRVRPDILRTFYNLKDVDMHVFVMYGQQVIYEMFNYVENLNTTPERVFNLELQDYDVNDLTYRIFLINGVEIQLKEID